MTEYKVFKLGSVWYGLCQYCSRVEQAPWEPLALHQLDQHTHVKHGAELSQTLTVAQR